MKLRIAFVTAALVFTVHCSLFTVHSQDVTFRADVRLVEVYATVLDGNRYVDDLPQNRFEVRDEGTPQRLVAFEPSQGNISCAILLDTTGSMARSLPAVKNGIVRLIDEFRDTDSVAVYRFAGSLKMLQEFTSDKATAKRSVLQTRAEGGTALFDSLAQLARELSHRNGKKAIVLFTDGADNLSVLNASRAIERSRKVGVPVYAVAQGEALSNRDLLKELEDIARRTGGRPYKVQKASDISAVFEDISNELKHTYLLAYKMPDVEEKKWRAIQLSVNGSKNFTIRSREGYIPE